MERGPGHRAAVLPGPLPLNEDLERDLIRWLRWLQEPCDWEGEVADPADEQAHEA